MPVLSLAQLRKLLPWFSLKREQSYRKHSHLLFAAMIHEKVKAGHPRAQAVAAAEHMADEAKRAPAPRVKK
jgi:hypothetical protein